MAMERAPERDAAGVAGGGAHDDHGGPGAGQTVKRTPRVTDRIYLELRQAILSGELQPGQKLRQTGVADDFAVSQSPVREAFERLASDGLVTLTPRRGAEVSGLSPREVEEIYEVREALDPHATALAVEHAGDGALARISDLAGASCVPGLPPQELFERNRAFHAAIYRASGNGRLVQIFEGLWNTVTAVRMFELYAREPQELSHSNDEHVAIAAALQARDDERATGLTRDHIRAARRDLLSHMSHMSEES